jgi:hypothetical protein
MIGKKVKVFWPVDESWYTGVVQEYDPNTGEHLLQYMDGDTEWVKIGDIQNNTAESSSMDHRHAPQEAPLYDISPILSSNNSAEAGEPKPSIATAAAAAGGDLAAPTMMGPSPPPPHYSAYGGGPYPPPPNNPSSGMPYMYGHVPPPGYYPPMPPQYGPASSGAPHWSYPPPYSPYDTEKGTMVDPSSSSVGYDYSSSSGAFPGDDDHPRGGGRKSGPKPWTKEEDALLLHLVHTMQWPMKWTVVANSLPDRTGKQCRERYVNHLNPRLKNSDWTPVEDATIFHLYNTIGSHWAKMSKIIPGRTDNGIKNRFHNIRRQYEREDTHRLRLSSVDDYAEEIRHDRLRNFPEHLSGKSLKLWDMKCAIGVLAAQSIINGSSSCNTANAANRSALSNNSHHGNRFGPFREVVASSESEDNPGNVELCIRCGFIVPSIHTGNEICTNTGWCMSCALLPPNVCSNLLRETLNLRRCVEVPVSSPATVELRQIIDSFEEFFRPIHADEAWPYRRKSKEGVVSNAQTATATATAAADANNPVDENESTEVDQKV